MKIDVQQISWRVTAQEILKSISLEAQQEEFIGLIGPNGSGKSSLLRLIYRILPPNSGFVFLNERNIWDMSPKETARSIAVVTQEHSIGFGFTVEEMVLMGRNPHKGLLDTNTSEDYDIIYKSLDRVGMLSFCKRHIQTLSGGEKQRVLIARALAQNAKAMILDEPTNHLDIRYQIEILELLRSLQITTIIAIHDLNLAAKYCHRLYLLHNGQVITHGTPIEVLTPVRIAEVYGVNAEVEIRSSSGLMHIFFTGLHPSPS